MKFQPIRKARAASLMALPERRLALKTCIEEKMIPALIEQESNII